MKTEFKIKNDKECLIVFFSLLFDYFAIVFGFVIFFLAFVELTNIYLANPIAYIPVIILYVLIYHRCRVFLYRIFEKKDEKIKEPLKTYLFNARPNAIILLTVVAFYFMVKIFTN